VAAGDDTRITGAAQKASNLSDLASAATARANLGAMSDTLGGSEKIGTVTGTSGGITLDAATGSLFFVTPTGNITSVSFSNLPTDNGDVGTYTLVVEQGASVRTVALGSIAGTIYPLVDAPTQAANKACIYTIVMCRRSGAWTAIWSGQVTK